MSRNPPTFTFGDDTSPVQRSRRSTPPNRKNNIAPGNRNSQQNRNNGVAPTANNNSYRQGGHPNGPSNQRQQPQTNYFTGDGWEDYPQYSSNNGNNDLTYSASEASSSVQSVESSSSFADILKHIDSDLELKDYSDPEIKEFMAKHSKAANDASGGIGHAPNGKMKGMEMDVLRAEDRSRQQAQIQMQQAQEQGKKTLHQFSKAVSAKHPPSTSGHATFNYSKDGSSEGDVCSEEFNEHEENVLETIVGKRDDAARHTVAVISAKSQASTSNDSFLQDPFAVRKQDPYQTTSSRYNNSPPSSPRSSRHITPPPNARQKRTSALSPEATYSTSRTNSCHSKSSSDGSWDTPAPSSPTQHDGGSMHSKPPHARSTPFSKTRRKSGQQREDEVVTGDALSEAFYAKSWMCGFADAITDEFNFDEFDGFDSGKTRHKSGQQREKKKVVTEDALSEQAFDAKPWMDGFTDDFNFDEFDRFGSGKTRRKSEQQREEKNMVSEDALREQAIRCLRRDFRRLQNDPPSGITGAPMDTNMMLWQAVIFGPDDSPWEGGIFKLVLEFTEDYPNKAPQVRFLTKMFHPNIYNDGRICLDILQNRWSPTYDISAILTSIRSLLCDPNLASSVNSEASRLYNENRREYNRRVRELAEQSWVDES